MAGHGYRGKEFETDMETRQLFCVWSYFRMLTGIQFIRMIRFDMNPRSNGRNLHDGDMLAQVMFYYNVLSLD